MKLWVDDERQPPEDGEHWWWAINSEVALHDLRYSVNFGEALIEVSLDHDLGGDDTGMIVLDWMIEHNVWPKTLTIHTANPPARQNMLRAANAEAPDWVDIFVKTW